MSSPQTKPSLSVDAALLLAVLAWGVNFAVVKATLESLAPFAFNSMRLVGASILLLALARLRPGPSILPEDRRRFLVLALVGHTAYQLFFIQGIHTTTASNSAILLGMTPVFVALFSLVLTEERPPIGVWLGIGVSVAGVGLVLSDSARLGGRTLGDLLTLGATLCWSFYTVYGQPAIARYGLFKTNAYTMAIGTLFFLPLGLPALSRLDVAAVPATAWAGTVFSLVFALVLAYSLWYYGVSRIGPTQTAVYANLTPVAAVAVAALWLGEPIGGLQLAGALTIFSGIYLVRRSRRRAARALATSAAKR